MCCIVGRPRSMVVQACAPLPQQLPGSGLETYMVTVVTLIGAVYTAAQQQAMR